jgi:plasmid stabilization system protein ParE
MIISPEAEADLSAAQDWYDQQRQGLGATFLSHVQDMLQRIERTPEMHAAVHQDVRRAVMRRFPYVIYYRILDSEVVVIAVVHGRRNPQVWQSRA